MNAGKHGDADPQVEVRHLAIAVVVRAGPLQHAAPRQHGRMAQAVLGEKIAQPGMPVAVARREDLGIFTVGDRAALAVDDRSEEHTSELQSLMRISYAVFCLKKKKKHINET